MDNAFTLLAFGLIGLFIGNVIARLSHVLPSAVFDGQGLFRCVLTSVQSLFSSDACCFAARQFPLSVSLFRQLFRRGRCPHCRRQAPADAAFIELGCAFIFMCLTSESNSAASLVTTLALTATLILLTLIDAKYYLLPDALTLPLLASGLIAAYAGASSLSLDEAIAGAIFGYALLWIPARLFLYFHRVHGLGQGDIKLMAAVGAWLGAGMAPVVLLVASLLGVLFFILRYAMTGAVKRHIPFGPFITFSMWLALLKDPFIIDLSIGIQAWL
ncbi:A24 family peptidase [Leminorella grimontii]|uniref:prepilin peptidase n=1 Tax=Leminorella grimontii TaxID=82981 RepID=UPI0032209A31